MDKDNKVVSDNQALLNVLGTYYSDLYSSSAVSNDEINQYLNKTEIPEPNIKDKTACDEPIREEELEYAIRNMKNNKSPRLDRLTPEFYKCFWQNLKAPYTEMLNESFEKGELPASLKCSVISLIYKKGDRPLLKIYRPISLTNYDHKILAFVLANRLKEMASKLIHPDQSGYIKGRFIGTNARLVMDIFEMSEKLEESGAIVCLDFQKAFRE